MAIEGGFEQLNNAEMLCRQLQNKMISDPHWSDINCAEMKEEDAVLIFKFVSNELSESDIDERMERLTEAGRNDQEDSSFLLAAFLKNKVVVKRGWEKRREKKRREAQL